MLTSHFGDVTTTKSGRDGQFRIETATDSGILVARSKSFRTTGQLLKAGVTNLRLVLPRTDEPASASLRSLLPVLPRDEELKLARSVLEPYRIAAIAEGAGNAMAEVLHVVALCDPGEALRAMDVKGANNTWKDYVCRKILRSLAGRNLDDALLVVESLSTDIAKIDAYCLVADALPAERNDRNLDLLAQALVLARNTAVPYRRARELAEIGKRLWKLGAKDRANEVLREAATVAGALELNGRGAYGRAAAAKALVLADLDAALAMIRDVSESHVREECLGLMACAVATANPAGAERLLKELIQASRREPYAARACELMATTDLARATALAAKINQPEWKAQALAGIAKATGGSANARELLNEAYAILEGGRPTREARIRATELLGVVEIVAPDLLEEYLWRALVLPVPRYRQVTSDHTIREEVDNSARFALLVARYDRSVARGILEQVIAKYGVPAPRPVYPDPGRYFFAAATVIDPTWALTLASKPLVVPGERIGLVQGAGGRADLQARRVIARILATEPNQRWDYSERDERRLFFRDEIEMD